MGPYLLITHTVDSRLRYLTPQLMPKRLIRLLVLPWAVLTLHGCDTTTEGQPRLASQGTLGEGFFDSMEHGAYRSNHPMSPTISFSEATPNARRQAVDDGVFVVGDRLHFEDPRAYLDFIMTVSEWSSENREEWEAESGFTSLYTHSTEGSEPSSNARVTSSEDIYMPDDAAASFLNPSGVVGIGDRVYDLEGDQVVTRDLDGGVVAVIPMLIPCEGNGGCGGGGPSVPPETPDKAVGYGPDVVPQETRTLKAFEGKGSIFRVHFFIYSSLGARLDNGVLDSDLARRWHYDPFVPLVGDIDCTGSYSNQKDVRKYFVWGENNFDNERTTGKVYFDRDVFDFTGTGSITRIECNNKLTSNPRSYDALQYPDRPDASTSFRTSRNF